MLLWDKTLYVRHITEGETAMKKILLSLTVGILLAVAFEAFAQEQAEAPTYKDGDFWQFRVKEWDFIGYASDALSGDYEVVYSQGKLSVFHLDGDQKIPVDRGVDELKRMVGAWKAKTIFYLQFPLFVGKQWRDDYEVTLRGSNKKIWRIAESRVTEIENVTTQAGIFRAFRIEREARGQSGVAGLSRFTMFYSSETKSVLKYSYDAGVNTTGGKRTIDLIKFGSAR
jgi:hypothetical protein